MDITNLQAFIAVARQQSFSAASEALHITQPAVSKRVASLEEELGIRLFHRVARQVSLTEAGSQLLPKAQALLEQAQDMRQYAMNLSTDISGTLSVAIAHHVGLHRMPPILSEFAKNYSEVALDIRFEDSDRALHMVEQGDIELAIITLPSEEPAALTMETVWRDPLSVVVGLDHPLSAHRSVPLQILSDYSCVLPERSTETHKIVARALAGEGCSPKVQMMTNNLESLRMLVCAGLGWSALPETMLGAEVHRLAVSAAADNGSVPVQLERQLGMVFHPKRSLSNAAQALVTLIRQTTSSSR